MRPAATVFQWIVRVCGLALLALGALFWSGQALRLVPLHMLLGITLVVALWTLAILGAFAGVPAGLVALALAWGLVVPLLGLNQAQLLPGSMHWIVRVVHLPVGLGAIGQAENLARRIKGRPTAKRPAVVAA